MSSYFHHCLHCPHCPHCPHCHNCHHCHHRHYSCHHIFIIVFSVLTVLIVLIVIKMIPSFVGLKWQTSENEFSDSECPNLKRMRNVGSLENCKVFCLGDPACTAFNYNSDGDCVLRGCTLPVVPPATSYYPHHGYWLHSTTGSPISPHISGVTLTLQCLGVTLVTSIVLTAIWEKFPNNPDFLDTK